MRKKPIQIEATPAGYTLTAEGLGTLRRLADGKLGFDPSETAPLAYVNREDNALTLAHQIGRYKLGLGDFVDTYTSAPFALADYD